MQRAKSVLACMAVVLPLLPASVFADPAGDAAAAAAEAAAGAAYAGDYKQGPAWTLIAADQRISVAKGAFKVTPSIAWSRSSSRPSRRGETWTHDGANLNELTFFGGVRDNQALYNQWFMAGQKIPRFRASMLPTDIVELFEQTNRSLLQTSVFNVDKVEPAKFGGHDGVRFSYTYAVQSDNIDRRGEAIAAIVDEKLYMVNFIAPALYYFDAYAGSVRKLTESAEIVSKPNVKKLRCDEADSANEAAKCAAIDAVSGAKAAAAKAAVAADASKKN